ncbi:MAG TPA: DUF1800 domain-containing protein [candidate division Zixibacteria bacterium]|nr:DUF1800 domain-containing protein [candidate division Zixibacteria bacterium]
MSEPLTLDQKVVHFLNRTSFGPTPETIARARKIGIPAFLEEQLNPDRISDAEVEERISGLKTIRLTSEELIRLYPPAAAQQRQAGMEAMQGPRVVIFELQQARLLRAVHSRRQLYEVMVDFWTNHFNIFAAKGANRWMTTAYDRDTIRPRALGRFRDLLLATAQSPAMLFYLDNWLSVGPDAPAARQGNRLRRGLNENYARELMELHTLGVDGGYTQSDVQEVARCFTGWTVRRPRGEAAFVFNPRMHDPGEKNVLGLRIPPGGGINDGMKVIDLLAGHPATARLIALKLARRFVSDRPPPSLVDRTAEAFRRSDGDIPAVLRAIFDSPEFYSPENYRAKIKKPLEFVASALRATGADAQISRPLLSYLARMGEPLFLAQPPTGFSDVGDSWISADTLLARTNFAADLAAGRLPGARVEIDPAELARRIAPEGLSAATRAVLSGVGATHRTALLLASPEFQRR